MLGLFLIAPDRWVPIDSINAPGLYRVDLPVDSVETEDLYLTLLNIEGQEKEAFDEVVANLKGGEAHNGYFTVFSEGVPAIPFGIYASKEPSEKDSEGNPIFNLDNIEEEV